MQQSLSGFRDIPEPLTPLLGREESLHEACALLMNPEVRLLTLTGMPGIGKTRLALALCHERADAFPHGICFIPLEQITIPDLILPALVEALGISQTNAYTHLEQIKAFLRDKQALLFFDSFEHVLTEAPLLTKLLANCPRLKILVTSRVVLRLEGEHIFPVPPLAVPDEHALIASSSEEPVAALALFVERARAVSPDFALTAENSTTIARICLLLEGIPLSIVLAAARSQLFPPDALLTQLEKERFTLLTRGTRDAPARHQSLQQAIGWSYELLSHEEQTLFRRLTIFATSFTLEEAQAICTVPGDLTISLVDGINVLLDHSLLTKCTSGEQEPHFLMSRTLRAYGAELLIADEGTHDGYDFIQRVMEEADHHKIMLPAATDLLRSPQTTLPGGLTPREVEVLRLLAMGLSNRHIANQLVLSPHTVSVHAQSIYGKLHINSRNAATRFAIEHHLT